MAAGVAELQILLKARDDAARVMARTGGAAQKAGQAVQKHWKAASVALGLAAAGVEKLARAQAEHTKIVEQLSAQQQLSTVEVRDLARELSNVTFPLEEVLALMQSATQQGLEGKDALRAYANFWDLVGDATGESGAVLGKAGVALKAVGIEVGQEAKALQAFGFIQDKTTSSVKDFLTFIEKTGPDLRKAGLDINDVAALLATMEKELGLAGRTARSEFRTELEAAKGDLAKTLEALGLTTDQVAKYRAEVMLTSGVIERNAQIHADSFTVMQKMQHQLGELAFAHAGVIQGAASLAPLMLVLGPAMGAAAPAARALGVAMRFMLGPWGLLIIAIIAVVAAGVLIIKNWDAIKDAADRIWGGIYNVVKGYINLYIGLFNLLIKAWNALEFKIPAIGIGPFKTPAVTIGTPDIPPIPTFAQGGVVPGPMGSPRLVMAHGGETITPAGKGGGDTIVFNFPNYAGDKRDIEDAVMGAMVRLQRRGRISAVTT